MQAIQMLMTYKLDSKHFFFNCVDFLELVA